MNKQEPELYESHERALFVHSIFGTIQGEGPHAGTPATFVRLAGCNLKCPKCDTDYTSTRQLLEPSAILDRVEVASPKSNLIVLTGGEPFRQSLGPFIGAAHLRGFRVQIETNGSMFRGSSITFPFKACEIVVSPKLPHVHELIRQNAAAWKYVISDGSIDWEDGLPTYALGLRHTGRVARPLTSKAPVYVQPCDDKDPERNEANLKAAIVSSMKYGHKLCLQIHKIIGLE